MSELPEVSSFAALPNFRHISSCGGVGFIQLLGSHTCVCSPRYLHLPPCQIFVIFRAVAVLASF
ncbi:hypothetical protein AB7352_19755, partial [Providencia alcalifaciens]|uniref:hypothetical protein n=1 Tax=Providencia alcalifaciens TaxID=126385 RepID=UPI0032DAE504